MDVQAHHLLCILGEKNNILCYIIIFWGLWWRRQGIYNNWGQGTFTKY